MIPQWLCRQGSDRYPHPIPQPIFTSALVTVSRWRHFLTGWLTSTDGSTRFGAESFGYASTSAWLFHDRRLCRNPRSLKAREARGGVPDPFIRRAD